MVYRRVIIYASTTRPQDQTPSTVPTESQTHPFFQQPTRNGIMKVIVKRWNAVAQWRWDTRIGIAPSGLGNGSSNEQQQRRQQQQPEEEDDGEEDVCGICRVAYEACCPACKTPGDDCPLSASSLFIPAVLKFRRFVFIIIVWGKCSHVFHMHCLLKWLGTAASKGQCPMDRREWGVFFSFFLYLCILIRFFFPENAER